MKMILIRAKVPKNFGEKVACFNRQIAHTLDECIKTDYIGYGINWHKVNTRFR